MVELFGWQFRRKQPLDPMPSFAPKETDDGALVIAAGGSFGTYVDLDGTVRTEAELVTKYREMALQPECDAAVDEIVNETMSIDEQHVVQIMLDEVDLTERMRKAIRDEFNNVLNLLDFQRHAYEIYRRWYIDGRLYYHVIIDDQATPDGIKELRYVDPRKIRKVREIIKRRVRGGVQSAPAIEKVQNEYYIYNDKGFGNSKSPGGTTTTGLRIARDAVVNVTSGLTDTNGTMVLSYLHKAIKALNQLRTLEDALVIYRLARAPERRIWYIDVGNLPKMKAEQYVRDIMVKHKNRLIYDAESGNIRDDRKFMCMALDTLIPLLDGRTLTLQEIIDEYKSGIANWVYSCDPVTGAFKPGPVSWAGVTRKNTRVVRITLDNGESVVITPDHPFPVWNKGFIEAQHLLGESLIPGYRRLKSIMPNGREYEQIYKNDTQTWEFTHREVAAWKDRINWHEEFVFSNEYVDKPKCTVHHKDFNGSNNSPRNLVMMNDEDHLEYHHSIQSIAYTHEIVSLVDSHAVSQSSIDSVVAAINSTADLNAWRAINTDRNPKNRSVESLTFTYHDLLRICKSSGYKDWREYRKLYDKSVRETNGRVKRGTCDKYSTEWYSKLSDSAKLRSDRPCKTWRITTPLGENEIIENLSAYCKKLDLNRSNIKTTCGSKGYHAEQLRNHKVIAVDWLEDKQDTGALTIDQNETYNSHHTYLLAAGVYTKNTMLEDYWLPRREGGRGTEVTTLPGGQTLGQMDDVLYFQKKFYGTLNVPVNRLNSDALFSIGRATEVTRDELKFARFVSRLRGKFSVLFTELLKRQLVLKQLMTIEDFENIEAEIKYDFAKDNYFTELKDAEILENRTNLARNLQDMTMKYYSHQWVRKNVLHQSDDDIEEQDKFIQAEMATGEIRWVNPLLLQIEQQEQMGAQQPGAEGGGGEEKPEEDEDQGKLAHAKARYQLLKQKKNKSLKDTAEMHSVMQIVAKARHE